MQVLSAGRVRRAESEWRAIVSRFESSGLSEAGFCRNANVSRKSFRMWRARLSAEGAPPRVRATRRPRPTPAAFVEWLAPNSPTPLEAKPGSGTEFELALPNDVVGRQPPDQREQLVIGQRAKRRADRLVFLNKKLGFHRSPPHLCRRWVGRRRAISVALDSLYLPRFRRIGTTFAALSRSPSR